MSVGLQRIIIVPSVLVLGCQIPETFAGNSSVLVLGKLRHIPSLTEIFLPPLILLVLCTLGKFFFYLLFALWLKVKIARFTVFRIHVSPIKGMENLFHFKM